MDIIHKNKCNLLDVKEVVEFIPFLKLDGSCNKYIKFYDRKNPILKQGLLYPCPQACFIDKFNNYFKLTLPKDDGVNIYAKSGSSIIKKFKKTMELCKYCVGTVDNTKGFTWEFSKKKLVNGNHYYKVI